MLDGISLGMRVEGRVIGKIKKMAAVGNIVIGPEVGHLQGKEWGGL